MSENHVKEISGLLNEEKWTRAALNSYTVANFKELDQLIGRLLTPETEATVKEQCDEHLQHTKNSIIALYISGIVALSRQQVDDSNLVTLINIFTDNRKWNIVEYLCKRILGFGENKFALRTLADCYSNENEEDEKYEVWERLIRVDFEEADIVRQLAERKEEDEDLDQAVEYYKKAIHRYINKKLFSSVKEIWHKLITYCPEDIDFFYHVDSKIAKTISPDRASQLLEDLYGYYKEQEDWDKSLDILKRILDYDSKNQWARKEITECFKQKYSNHSQLDEYIRLSNLNQSWRNVHEAIEDFEKHISFDQGSFVCHRSWGVGRISSIEGDDITIDFARKRGHTMSLKMAVSALTSLSKDHIWVLRATLPKKKLHDKVKGDAKWALKTVIRSHSNAASMKTIKSELVPGILTAGEWSSWSTEARKLLKTDPEFGNLPDKLDQFVVRATPISYEEKTFNRFKAEDDFFGRLKTILEFLNNADPESEFFREMFDYFTSFLKSYNTVNDQVIAAFLLVKRIVRQYPFLNPGFDVDFKALYTSIEDLESICKSIQDTELKRDFLEHLKQLPGWPEIFVRVFPVYMSRYIIEELDGGGYQDQLRELLVGILDSYKEYREPFVWLARTLAEDSFERFDVPFEKILIGMIHLLDITFREIENRRDVSDNRRLNRQIQTYLFKEKKVSSFIEQADEDSISRIYTLVEDVKELDPSIRIELRHTIMERFPEFKFFNVKKAESVNLGLLVTSRAYEERRKELQRILEVEVPKTSKEIGNALQMGDLRENAEYKAAKERQDMLNATVARLNEEIEKAQIFDEKEIDPSKISFGTQVTLLNKATDEEETYAILGPWESDPSNNVISYLSPFGSELWSHKANEELEFIINGRSYIYEVRSIKAYDFASSPA